MLLAGGPLSGPADQERGGGGVEEGRDARGQGTALRCLLHDAKDPRVVKRQGRLRKGATWW